MKYILYFCALIFFLSSCRTDDALSFRSQWSQSAIERHWAGQDYWLNPLQSWKQKNGKIQCVVSGGDRNVTLLTRELNNSMASFKMSVHIDPIATKQATPNDTTDPSGKDLPKGLNETGWAGFQIGRKGQFNDYRDDAIKGIGVCAGLMTDGRLFIGDLSRSSEVQVDVAEPMTLEIEATPRDSFLFDVTLTAKNQENEILVSLETIIHRSWLTGTVALTCSQSIPDTQPLDMERPEYSLLNPLNKQMGGNTLFAFSDWMIAGDKISVHDERSYGPILWAQHTLSDSVMKMSVQMVPVGDDNREVTLTIDEVDNYTTRIDDIGRNALFRIDGWNSSEDHTYKIRYSSKDGTNHFYDGIVKNDPLKTKLKVASLSCVDDRGFPHQDLVDNVMSHKPDMYIFHGDQLYERVAGYGVERNSILDYLRKWYIFGWSFRDAIRDIPAIIIPDDHDVFHGNLWGEGGKKADVAMGYGYDSQDDGGYKEPPVFVNMVHRTQTGHLPDPYDPTPVQQGISVYYTNLNYGGISFAILGDRQWKSAPKALLPDALIENGWPQNKKWNAKTESDHPSAELLGPRQEAFLESWIEDWEPGVAFKCVVSQSPFSNIATLPADIYHDKYVPQLPIYKEGEYPPDDRPVADFDSNAWPQSKRNKALKVMRKAAAIHLAGDQHLGSMGQYGVDQWGDAGFWVATPAVSNLWPRRWYPAKEAKGGKRLGDSRRYAGNFEDGFGNKITVRGVANPIDVDIEPSMVFDKAPGYTVVEFDRIERTIKVAVWPRWASPALPSPDNVPFDDWPIVIDQDENLGGGYKYELEPIEVDGSTLVKVYNLDSKDLICSYIPKQGIFNAPVPSPDTYYIVAINSDGNKRTYSNMTVKP